MAKRGKGKKKVALKAKIVFPAVNEKPSAKPTASSNTAVPNKVHPTTNNCYPLNKLCRLCLLSNTNMEPIFPYPGDTRLAKKIYECTNLQINEVPEEGIPTAICGQCKKQLEQCHEFRLLCWKNNEILHNLHAILSPMKAPEINRSGKSEVSQPQQPHQSTPNKQQQNQQKQQELQMAQQQHEEQQQKQKQEQLIQQLQKSQQQKMQKQKLQTLGPVQAVSTPRTPRSVQSPKYQSPSPQSLPPRRSGNREVSSISSTPLQKKSPVVELQKLDVTGFDLQQYYSPPMPKRGKRSDTSKLSFGEVSLSQLYTPSRRGHKASKTLPKFARELVVALSPISPALINKYKRAAVTQTKAAVKSFPVKEQPSPRGRPKVSPKPPPKTKVIVKKPPIKPPKTPIKPVVKAKVEKKVVKPVKITKPVKVVKPVKPPKPSKPIKPPVPPAKKTKAPKSASGEIAVPPKKRKENFESQPISITTATITCALCTQTFNNEKNLSRHMAAHENSRKTSRVFNCEPCGKEYLKAVQLDDHLDSAEHMNNIGESSAEIEAAESILPDEDDAGVSILPDNDEEQNIPVVHPVVCTSPAVESSQIDESAETTEPEIITDEPVVVEDDRSQQSPDTNVAAQPVESAVEEQQPDEEEEQPQTNNTTEPVTEEAVAQRDASPIPVDSESSKSPDRGVQYSDVCSTNNAENLFNGSGTESCNSRRVTFSDITEIVE